MHQGARLAGMSLAPSLSGAALSGSGTFLGLEELILQVNNDLSIGYINAPMARLLGVAERRSTMGEPLDKWDSGPLGPGVLRSVVDSARAAGGTVVLEKVCPDLPQERLPSGSGPRPACPPLLRFVANEVKGRVEIIVQDVTRMRWLEDTFSRYVAPEIIQQMLARPQQDFMQMERRELTVLFADLRGFTAIAQRLEPALLQKMLNRFLSDMVGCVGRVQGLVDKFIGDQIMAVFGAPLPCPDHALRGLLAALDMVRTHQRTLMEWEREGIPPAGVGVGLTSGEAIVGNLGTESRIEYTAIGHNVNLAARLCAAAGPQEVLTTGDCYQQVAEALKNTQLRDLPRFKFSPRGKQQFKNVSEPVTVLAVSEL